MDEAFLKHNCSHSRIRACGIVFCYNEEHIIGECLQHYLKQNIDLVVIDNCSTDLSMAIVQRFRQSQHQYPGKIRDVLNVQTDGYEWKKILKTACEYMHTYLSGYEWILLIDADAFYVSAVKGMSLFDFMEFSGRHGYNILEGALFEFYPTQQDDMSITSVVKRMRYCKITRYLHEQKIFHYHNSIDFYTRFGHQCIRKTPRISVVNFIYKHYPWVSYDHGLRKIFQDRRKRYVERIINPSAHAHYMDLLPIAKDLVKDSSQLTRYSEIDVLVSCGKIAWMLQFRSFIAAARFLSEKVALLQAVYLVYLWNMFLYARSFEFKYIIDYFVRTLRQRRRQPAFADGYIFRSISKGETAQQKPFVMGFPLTYHFLITNACNALCIFCNQTQYEPDKSCEITLDKFKAMLAHIPTETVRTIYFSGGGEPLLAKDLFPIIEYINERFPWVRVAIRTNGLLIKKYAQELLNRNITQLEVSVHAVRPEVNRRLLQVDNPDVIFDGLKLLNALKSRRNKMRTVFYTAVSDLNIDEVAYIVRKAAELKIPEVMVFFCRYYQEKSAVGTDGDATHSLFFAKERYNNAILASRKIAQSYGITFNHEPRFFQKFHKLPCLQPWDTLIVDCDGDIYPCTGGEVWFGKKVKSGEYRFGNLLQENLVECWNSVAYIMIRRTCNFRMAERFIPECEACHNTICLHGADVKEGHLLKLC